MSISGWVLGIGGVESAHYTEFWGRATFCSASFMPATFLAFSRVFPVIGPWPARRIVYLALFLAAILATMSSTTDLIAYGITRTPLGIQRSSGALYPLFAVYFVVCTVTAFSVFIGKWKNARGMSRAQLQYLGIGLLILSVGALTTNLFIPILTGRSTYSWLGPYFTLPLVMLVGHTIIRHRLMDIRLAVHQSLVFGLMVAALSFTIIPIRRFLLPGQAYATFLHPDILVIVLVALALLSFPGQRIVGHYVDTYLFRRRIDYAASLREATHRLTLLRQPDELSAEIRAILHDAFLVESFALAARPLDGGALEILSKDTSIDADLVTVAALLVDEPAPSVLLINPSRETGLKRKAHDTLRARGIELVVALGRRDHTLGAILLGPRRSGDPYFVSDLNFVESVAQLSSIALENALLYRQRIQILEYSERLLESLNSGVVAADATGRITSFNPAAESLLGLTASQRGASLSVLPSEVGWALALAMTGTWQPREVEATIANQIRGPLPIILSTAVLHDQSGQVTGALVVTTDLSAVKELERNQRRIEHLSMMARFYAGIAHEIRSPLASISNLISMLPDRFNDAEYRDTAVRLLPLEVGRIVRLADRLRLMAPSEDGKLMPISLPPLLEDIVRIHGPSAEESRVKIILHCPDTLPPVLGDRSQLVQLFLNLLRNAIEAMPQGGTVRIEALTLPADRDYRVTVRIIDEGIGIDTLVRAQVFEPFFTTKPTGTGLGLSICREIADFHRAKLSLLSRHDRQGTIAHVEFSVVPSEPSASGAHRHTVSVESGTRE
jgi:signal transduction histidine kinase